jgi:signal transduction histidine kinase
LVESANRQQEVRQQEVLRLDPNSDGSKIPLHSRIGTKLIVGFLIIATITGTVGYLSLNYSQTVGEKFHLLVQHTLPAVDSLKELKVAALSIETATNEYVFTPEVNRDKFLQEINAQKNELDNNLKKYEDFVNKYFQDETDLTESIHKTANVFIQNSDKLVQLRQSVRSSVLTLPASVAQQALTIEEGFQTSEEALFQSIDNAIANEIDEVQTRIQAVDTAINNSGLVTLSSIIISVIVAIVFGLFFSRYISNPISNLKQASIQIGKGDYVTACKFLSKTHRGDEIGKLSSEIEKMRQSIESMKNNLDALVEQRTKELEIKNRELFEKEKDLESANEELRMTDRAKEEFISMVSHELKTPIGPAKGYIEMLLRPKIAGELSEKQRKYANTIYRNIQKLEILVSDVLDVYKLDMGKLKLSKSNIEIHNLLGSVQEDLKLLTFDKEINFMVHNRTNEGTSVFCDPKRIEQVLANLIKNSIDFVPDKDGKIVVTVQEDPENHLMVQFSIEDNGIGIPAEKIDKLFEKFYQIDTTTTRKHGGTGLGLAICRGIIEAHDGRIWVDKGFVNGTRIIFTLQKEKQNPHKEGDGTNTQ